ncbi:hypothetical protein V8F06_011999 [Rhypophila decipiens]
MVRITLVVVVEHNIPNKALSEVFCLLFAVYGCRFLLLVALAGPLRNCETHKVGRRKMIVISKGCLVCSCYAILTLHHRNFIYGRKGRISGAQAPCVSGVFCTVEPLGVAVLPTSKGEASRFWALISHSNRNAKPSTTNLGSTSFRNISQEAK